MTGTPRRTNCFVIAPIGQPGSAERRAVDGLIRSVVTPVAVELGLTVHAAHHMSASGSITGQIIEALLEDALVVADLTGLNANVMYELAIRHAARLPVVMIATEHTKLPFDVAGDRTIYYVPDLEGREDLLPTLRKAATLAVGEADPDNPVYRAAKSSVLKAVHATDSQAFIIERLEQIAGDVQQLRLSRGEDDFKAALLNRLAGAPSEGGAADNGLLVRYVHPEKVQSLLAWTIKKGAFRTGMKPTVSDDVIQILWTGGPSVFEVEAEAARRGLL